MRYPTATVLGLILLAALASRAAADSFGGVLKVIEIAEHEQDPWALVRLHDVEDQISEHGQRIENLKRERFTNRDEARQRSEQIKQYREQIVAPKKRQRELRREVAAGMTDIRGWLGIEGSQIVIECRGTWRKEAKRLQAGVIVDFVAENVSRSHTVAGTAWRRDWIGPLDLEEVTK